MAPEELARRIWGGLAHMMYPLPYSEPRGRLSSMPLHGLAFLTRPRKSYRAGLCETDRIVVAFERVPFGVGPDPEVRPYRFQTYENHFIQDFAKAREGGPAVEEEGAALDLACAAIDPRKVDLIVASTPFPIVASLDTLADLVEAAKAGRPLAPLDCRNESGESVEEPVCLRSLAQLDPAKMYHADYVDGCGRKEPEIYCRWVEVWDGFKSLDINFEFRRGGEEPLRVRVRPSLDESSLAG